MRGTLAAVLALAASGCTLLGLADFEIPVCVSDDECEVVNADEGIGPSECIRWQCTGSVESGGGVCVKRARDDDDDESVAAACGGDDCDDAHAQAHPGGEEVCDGLDGDCDGTIDEVAAREGTVVASEIGTITSLTAHPEAVAWTSASSEARWLATGDATPLPMGYQRTTATEPASASLTDIGLTGGCHALDPSGTVVWRECDFGDLALDFSGTTALVAAVNTDGCAAGQLRLGFLDVAASPLPNVIVRGPTRRSNSFLGVDLLTAAGDPQQYACSGGDRPASERGAARPAVAAMSTAAGPQALVAWLAAPLTREECAGDETAVLTLAALERSTVRVAGWVTASNDGTPQAIGRTRGGSPPAVAAREDVGYFVAHGDERGELAIHFVAPAGVPTEMWDGVTGVPTDPSDPTPPLAVTSFTPLAHVAEAVRGAALAIDRDLAAAPHLGVAWREGCGGAGAIFFRRVPIAAPGAVPSVVEADLAAPILLSAAGEVPSAPVIAYVPSGLRTAAEADDGGWIVAWIDRATGRAWARRLSERDGALVDPEPLTLARPGDTADLLAVSAGEDGAGFAYADRGAQRVVTGPLTCAPP